TFDILKRSGILTIGDLANANPIFLKSILGKNGEVLIRKAKGLDNSVVNPIKEKPKSISISRTQPEDLKNNDEIKKLVLEYCVDISKQLRQNKLKCSGVGILIKDSDFKSFDAQKKLDFFTNTTDDIYNCAYALFLKNYLWKKLVRSVGIKVYDLVDQSVCVQMDFFQTAPARIKKENLEKCVDEISYKYGNNTLKRGSLL
ncbi:MAG: DNA polymerase IV, partial [Oscillospiraceae bacterium]